VTARRDPVFEKSIVDRIMAAFKKVPGLVCRKRHGTAFGVAGDPDIYVCYKGQHYELEVKRPCDPNSRPTKLQERRLEEWAKGGAIVAVVRSAPEALAVVGILPAISKPEPVWLCSGCLQYRWQADDPPARCPACGHTRFGQEVVRS
jgi:hypothetical protein